MAVEFKGEMRAGATGRAPIAIKRALARAGFGSLKSPATHTPVFGRFAVQHLKDFQRTRNIPQSGVLGERTFDRLVRYFDAYCRYLYTGLKPGMTEADLKRQKIVDAARYFMAIGDRVHYTQSSSRMMIVREKLRPPLPPNKHVYEDCSSWVTGLYWIAGAPDPNGRGYDGEGFTGTLRNNGRRVPILQAKPGDLCFYGAPEDVKVYIGKGRVIGNGGEFGPLEIGWSWRHDYHETRSYL